MLPIALLLKLLVSCAVIGINGLETMDFSHETCQVDTLTSNTFQTFYSTNTLYNENGVLDLLVRFKGIADGHVILTVNASDLEPRYYISLGSYNNKVSEIRRAKPSKLDFKMNTPGILSDRKFHGFLIRYDSKSGGLRVFSEGSDKPLLYMIDPEPLEIQYFSFGTWLNRVVQVAFDCQPKDTYSTFSHKGNNSKSMRTT